MSGGETGVPDNISRHEDHDDAEDVRGPVCATTTPAAAANVGMSLLALVCEDEAVLDTATALEDVRVIRRGVALTDDLGAAKLEGRGQGRGARPLDVLGAIAGALVDAAHGVDLVQRAHGPAGYAFQLGYRGDAAVRGLAVGMEGEGLDLKFRRGRWSA